ncbi:hypothetical protein BQ8794_220065 [Mesorhizobium prunaredense]|uniref:Uncharacterized protein n=1 Tax=Mesorhizobium prunaredense TaxID=1631249 RepID=A0A1R3V6K7_9HYPH|nr:hypothetical protein BQ8794_220065 [Mesorhizobium prunaredense]
MSRAGRQRSALCILIVLDRAIVFICQAFKPGQLPVGHFFGEAYQGVDLLHLVHMTVIGDVFPDPLQLVRGSSQRFGD